MLTKIDALVVDDTPDSAHSLALLLEQDGYDVRYALSGEDALATMETCLPLCVILDVNMPGMDGLELCKHIKARYQDDVVLIALTGQEPGDPRVAATFDLVDHYFSKPLPPEELAKIFPPRPSLATA